MAEPRFHLSFWPASSPGNSRPAGAQTPAGAQPLLPCRRGALAVDEEDASSSARKVIATGILINILNPKLTIFFLAFLPQFVSPDEPQGLLRMVLLSAVFMLLTFVIFVIYGVLAAAVRDRVITRPRVLAWTRRVFAGSFVALGAKLAFTRQ